MTLQTVPLLKDIDRPPENILINVTPQETRVAIMEAGNVTELHIERDSGRGLVGNIYLGLVKRVLPGMQSAFIDIGLERSAFLHIVDIFGQRDDNQEEPQRIEQVLSEGQSILVQVIKDPINSKGARLSTQISLAGRFLVLLPQDDHIGISQRIEVEEERLALKHRLEKLLGENGLRGYIIRTNAETATDAELESDVFFLNKLWTDIQQKAKTAAAESVIFQDLPLSLRVLRDMTGQRTEKIIIDSTENYFKMREFAEKYVHIAHDKIEHYRGDKPLFETYGVENEIDLALKPKVNLKFGGYLIIEQTEAMTTIDINTGGFVGNRSFDETIFKTNLEATHVLARQLRLRNLGGIIVVDFIDMENEEHQQIVLHELTKALSYDRTRVTVSDFTSLGLIEITRKRARESLSHIMCESCPTCRGRGKLKTNITVCYEIQREIVREARRYDVKGFRILAAPSVIDMFLDEESQSLAMLVDFVGKPIFLAVENTYTQEMFDVVLL